jgi:predicted dehydrogenase
MDTIKWGILSTAKIGIEKVIPSIQQASNCTVVAISSRSSTKAQKAAEKLNIPRYYSSYEDLLADPEIDAIYNPLPNHLHVPQTIRALEADKHVLCEKPIALDAEEAQELLDISKKYPELKVMEAFMYRFHPQWIRTKSMVEEGEIGKLQTIESFFSYYNDDPDDIRNKAGIGGGGLMDIGCYCISLSRFLFDNEPENVIGQWKIDPQFKTDYLASGILDFGSGISTFTCATQTAPHQEVNIVGTKGRIVIDIPFNAPLDKQTSIWHIGDKRKEEIVIDPANQYMLQAEEFAKSILKGSLPPTPLEDAIQNMTVIDDFRKSTQRS